MCESEAINRTFIFWFFDAGPARLRPLHTSASRAIQTKQPPEHEKNQRPREEHARTQMALFPASLSWTAACLLLLVLILCLGYCLYVQHIHMKYDHIPGPPRDSFLFGHSATYLVYFAVLICQIFSNHAFLSESVALFSRFLGNGLVTAQDHEQWYKQRRIMDPAFSSLYLRGLIGTFNERVERLMSKLSDVADNQTEAGMLQLVNFLTLDVIAKVAFGVDLDLLKDRSRFPKAVQTCLKGMVFSVRDNFFYNPKNRSFIEDVREACRLLRTTGAQWIKDRKTAMESGDDVPNDILTQIIKSAVKEEIMTEEDEELMLDNFMTFFIAGHETTANLLAFCIMELTRLPDVLEKVKKEVDDVIGMKQDITCDDLGKLVYLSQVLKETLRIYPTAPGTSRDVLQDIVIDGIHIPGGVTCFFSSYVTGRMDKFFKDPLTFDPDRFHPDAPKPYFCYYPFALGPRACLGKNFAQMEAKVFMAKLVQRFDFSLLPGQTFDLEDCGTLRPKSGVVCSVRHRDHNK
uniref:Cholesterol 24-hydroxylase n=1 Tax=Gasterosteus aculeatus aculeatus TaxID=481459 RepID=A0AAQ4R5G5_GASAC